MSKFCHQNIDECVIWSSLEVTDAAMLVSGASLAFYSLSWGFLGECQEWGKFFVVGCCCKADFQLFLLALEER